MWTEPEVSLCFFNPLPLTEPVTGHLGDMNEFGGCADIQVLKPLEESVSCSPKSVTILGNSKQIKLEDQLKGDKKLTEFVLLYVLMTQSLTI